MPNVHVAAAARGLPEFLQVRFSALDIGSARPADQLRLRRLIEATIDGLIDLLDEITGDPDLEDSDEDEECHDEGVCELGPDFAGAVIGLVLDGEANGPAMSGPDPWRA